MFRPYLKLCQTSMMELFAKIMHFPADLVTFTEKILNGKLYLLCSVIPNFEHGAQYTVCYSMLLLLLSVNPMVIPYYLHCVKSVQIRSFFWSVFSYIRTEGRKIRTRKNSVFGHFSHSAIFSPYP